MRFEKWLSNNWFCYGLIALLTMAVWGRSIDFEFVWDDDLFITLNRSVYSLKNIPSMFFSEEAQSSMPGQSKIFRPLRTAFYSMLTAVTGKGSPQPWIFHLANLVWHALAACLLFVVARRLFEKFFVTESQFSTQVAALLLAAGFAVHPVTSEVVCWAKSLDDIMATVFVLATLAALLKWNGTARAEYLAALGWFALAVYSKESAVPLVLVVFLIFCQVHRLAWKENFLRTFGFAIVAFVYVVHRHFILGQMSQCPPLSGSYGQTLIDMFPVVSEYTRLLLGIPPFCIDYAYMKGHNKFLSTEVLTGVFLLFVFASVVFWMWRRNWLVAFGLIWVGVFMLPVSNLLPMMQYMAERFLYLPLIGFLLAVTAVLLRFRPRLSLLVGIILVIAWAPLSWSRCGIWRDPLTLFVRTSQENPHNARVEKNAVVTIFRLPHMRAFLPDYVDSQQLNIAQNISPEQLVPVLRTLEEARRLFPNNEKVLTFLAFANAKAGNTQLATTLAELVVRENPDDAFCWANLASLSFSNTNLTRAREACAQTLRLDTNNIDALRLSARMLLDAGDQKGAEPLLRRLEEVDPRNPNYRGRSADANKSENTKKVGAK